MDVFLPGVYGWESVYNNPAIWHFRFNGPTPEALVKGNERIYFEHYWNDFAPDKARSIPDSNRKAYAAAYARPGRMRAGLTSYRSNRQPKISRSWRELNFQCRSFRSAATKPMATFWGAREIGGFGCDRDITKRHGTLVDGTTAARNDGSTA
jgi:hypothetical protein